MSVGPLSAVSPSAMYRHSALESPGEHIKILDLGDESLEMLSNRTFCSDGNVLLSVLSGTVTTSHMSLWSISNVAGVTKELKF